jgi:hypothetical protein
MTEISTSEPSSPTNTTAWTPGPWCVQRQSQHIGAVWTGTDPNTHGNPLAEVHRQRGGMGSTDWLAGSAYMRLADAELVALAPDMATAILRYSKGGHGNECGLVSCAACEFARLASLLRAIGASDVE